jgi:MraZ protein
MPDSVELILGEFQRRIDDRFRLSIPGELGDLLAAGTGDCILAKERPGCLSLWNADLWQARLESKVQLVRHKIQADALRDRIPQVQLLGRLLSTRHTTVQLAGRGRLLIPEGFRECLAVERGEEVIVVGAAVCIEIWQPAAWWKYLEDRLPKFRRLLDKLSE